MAATYPVSILQDGPAFTDELAVQSAQVPDEIDGERIETLYLVPTKSAAKGVYQVRFKAGDRHWALVRLAQRYRWVLEVQLLRGMSGERQLLNQGLTGPDLEFIQDILPRPETEYSTIVYDMLWVAAEYRNYLVLARAMAGRPSFTPEGIIADADGVSVEDAGLFTRFLRSHLITPVDNEPLHRQGPSDERTVEMSVTLDKRYKLTEQGKTAIPGIVSEYARIFETQDFTPLLLNPELDPLQHFKNFEPVDAAGQAVPKQELETADGILGDIAGEFIEDSPSLDSSKSESTVGVDTDDGPDSTPASGSDTSTVGSSHNQAQPGIDRSLMSRSENDQPPTQATSNDTNSERTTFSDAEIMDGVHAAVTHIQSENVVRTAIVKQVVWDAISLNERDRGDYWDSVRTVLTELSMVHGRPSGRLWLSTRFTEPAT